MPDTTALDQDLERRQRQLEQLDRPWLTFF